MRISKTASSGIFKFLEKIIRSHPLVYFIFRYLIRYTNIFEDDAHGVSYLKFHKKINIIDVGASDGIASKFFMKKLNVSNILCFEPNIPYVKILKKLNYKKMRVYDYGIGERNANYKVFYPRYQFLKKNFDLVTYTFYDRKELQKQINLDFKFKKNIKIVQKKIFLKKIDKLNLKISLIKIDVNGNELSVVKGLNNVIKKNKPALIIETDKNINKINDYLEKFNYKKYSFQKKKKSFEKIKNTYPLNTYFLQSFHLD
jgi:FkbM family methyltransferase